MTGQHDAILERNEQLRAIVAAEVALTAAAYGLEVPVVEPEPVTVAPVEVVPASWEEARDSEEARRGVGIWKFFRLPGCLTS